MVKFNLIVTCGRFMEFNAMRELENVFYLLGEEDVKLWESRVRGIILVYTKMDSHKVISKVRSLINERPWGFRFTKRYIPIDLVVDSKLEKIKEVALALADRIPNASKYRITVEKRFSDLRTREIIAAIAPSISRRVSLEEPDYVLLIEILGDYAGVSLIRPDEILSVERELLSEG